MKVVEVDNKLEERILIGLIVSDSFCKQIVPIARPEYFRLPFARRLLKWISDYFQRYEKAPFLHIQDIFLTEKINLREEEVELIEEFLYRLSKEYSEGEEDLNVDYLVDQTFSYFRRRSLEILTDNMRSYLMKGEVDRAESVLRNYKKTAKEVSKWENPFSPEALVEVFDSDNNELFRFPGILGDLIGSLERGQLVGVMGSMKKGKSWFLQEFAIQAVASKRRVAYISLEMPTKVLKARILKRISGRSFQEGTFLFPVFDCRKNQVGSCQRPERACKVALLDRSGKFPQFNQAPKDYKPCTYCRENDPENYKPAVWFVMKNLKRLDFQSSVRISKGFMTMFGDKLRIKSYPPFSASFSQILADIDQLEYSEGFVPDVIVIDYADIIAPERFRAEERHNINEVWKWMKRAAMERHCLVVTASQTNRGGIKKSTIEEEDTAEDIRKLAHVDLLLTLNQSEKERNFNLLRVGVLVKREGEFNPKKHVGILTNFNIGQFLLDSYWFDPPSEEEGERKKR